MSPLHMKRHLQPWRRRRRAVPVLLLALAAAMACMPAPAGAEYSNSRVALDSPSRALLGKKQEECGMVVIPPLNLDDPAAVATLDVAPRAADGSNAPQAPPMRFRQYQVIYKTEVIVREMPEHFMYSLGTFSVDESNETVQIFRGGEPYLKNEDCPGPSSATVTYVCREDAPAGQEQLVEALEASPGSCDFRLTVETRRVCARPLDEL